MFKLVTEAKTVTWPVTVGIPQEGGKVQKATFEVEFEVLATEETEAVVGAGGDLLDRVVKGWKPGQVKDSEGNDIAFSDEAKKQLLNVSYVRTGMFTALGEINSGRAAARKN